MCRLRLILSVLVAILGVTLASDTLDSNNKRGPSGFQGVRGKKSIRDTYPDNSFYTSEVVLDKRIPSAGFHGMRGKKLHTEKNELLLPLSIPKRAPMGFMGMRGKKEIGLLADELDKRASKGFLGMRGKKEFENNEEENMLNDYYMEKRAPNGFMGMRGKKYSLFIGDEKRAPSNTFFGMRGKKQPSRSGFFVMRGKKYPYEFREKFVGVRGKKQSAENDLPNFSVPEIDADNFAANLDLNELMLLLSEERNSGSNWEKEEGPSAFLGMHG